MKTLQPNILFAGVAAVAVMLLALVIADAADANGGATLLAIVAASVVGALGLVWALGGRSAHHR